MAISSTEFLMTTGWESYERHSARISIGVLLVWVYAFWLITTPYLSPHMEFLGTIRFERFLAGALAIYSLMNIGARARDTKPLILFTSFFGISLASALFSPIQSEAGQFWLENYWKLWLYFFFIVFSIRTVEDVYLIMFGIAVISFGYQLLSWRDFLVGGSYVFQQGIKRIVGVWSGGGYGAPNGFALTSLFTIPLFYTWILTNRRWHRRALMVGGVAVSVASIIFSGTRGAILVGLAVMLLGLLLFTKNRFRFLTFACIAAGGCYLVAPKDIQRRYTDLLLPRESSENDDATNQVAMNSAHGRINGIVDGWLLFLRRPVFGWGPGQSATARMGLDNAIAGEPELELHSLYGQILGETGACGTVLFVWLNWYLLLSLVGIVRDPSNPMSRALAAILLAAFAITILYGFVSHILFRYYWIILFGLSTVLISEHRDEREAEVQGIDERELRV